MVAGAGWRHPRLGGLAVRGCLLSGLLRVCRGGRVLWLW